nr:MAG TPA: hypothetical protein [Caudoviricetes sp.]
MVYKRSFINIVCVIHRKIRNLSTNCITFYG